MSRRANGERSIYPYRNGFAARVWIVMPKGRRQRKTVYGKTRAEVHDTWLRLREQARRGPMVPVSPRLRAFLEAAVRGFQQAPHTDIPAAVVDGVVVGPVTWQALFGGMLSF